MSFRKVNFSLHHEIPKGTKGVGRRIRGVRKIRNFQPISRHISETVHDRTNRKSHIRAFDWYQNHRPRMTLNGVTHSIAENMRLLEPTAKVE